MEYNATCPNKQSFSVNDNTDSQVNRRKFLSNLPSAAVGMGGASLLTGIPIAYAQPILKSGSDVFNVKAYGAIGDGAANDTLASSAAFSCESGARFMLFDHVLVTTTTSHWPGSGIAIFGRTDTVTIRDCLFSGLSGTGVRIGNGAAVWIVGGRLIGRGSTAEERLNGSIGVHLSGGNGGVHIVGTDVIQWQWGVRTDFSPPPPPLPGNESNREIFITHATLDTCWRGLAVRDNSYLSITGCWVAACDQENIHVDGGLINPLLVISGGTIFNAGANGGTSIGKNGITVNSGSFMLTGVTIRNNLGKGIWVPTSNVYECTVTGCRIAHNGQGALMLGTCYTVQTNIFVGNATASQFSGTNFLEANNLSC